MRIQEKGKNEKTVYEPIEICFLAMNPEDVISTSPPTPTYCGEWDYDL